MKYIITEEQNNRIRELIKKVAENFTNEQVKKTEVFVQERIRNGKVDDYVLYPTFYIIGKKKDLDVIDLRLEFADYVENIIGIGMYAGNARFKKYVGS
jgi:hypothetical protein